MTELFNAKTSMSGNIFEETETFEQKDDLEEELNTIVFASHFGAQAAFKKADKIRHMANPDKPLLEGDAPVTLRFPVTKTKTSASADESREISPQHTHLTFGVITTPTAKLMRMREAICLAKVLIEGKQPLDIIVTDPEGKVGPKNDIPASIFEWKSRVVNELLNQFGGEHCDPEFPGMQPDKRLWHITRLVSKPGDHFVPKCIDLKTIGSFDPFITIFLEELLEESKILFRFLKPKRVFAVGGKRHVVDQKGEITLPLCLFV